MGRAYTLEPAAYLEGSIGNQPDVDSPFDGFGEVLHEFNLDQSAPSRGVQVWAILREIGKAGMAARVKRHNGFARHLSALVEQSDCLEQLAPVVLSICCFRYTQPDLDNDQLNDLNRRLVARLRAEGDLVPSTTVLQGRLAIRPCYINPRSRPEDVDLLVRRSQEIGRELADEIRESPAP
jgi:aromatic-L-amino-acid decarboxylase